MPVASRKSKARVEVALAPANTVANVSIVQDERQGENARGWVDACRSLCSAGGLTRARVARFSARRNKKDMFGDAMMRARDGAGLVREVEARGGER